MIDFLNSWLGLALMVFIYLVIVGDAHSRLDVPFHSSRKRTLYLVQAIFWPVLLPYWIGRRI